MHTLSRSRFLAAAFTLLAAFAFFALNVSPAAANFSIDIEKHTNGVDADLPEDAPILQVGDPVVWEYIVTNTGDGPGRQLEITVTDDQGVDVICSIDILYPGESTTCYGYGIAEAGLYGNVGCVDGIRIRDDGTVITVSDCDPSHYYGEGDNPPPPPPPPTGDNCSYTQGYWKTHGPNATGNNSNEWPVTSLTLGNIAYTDSELQAIFDQAVKGNGLVSLAHQLIAAKLNVANGADGSTIAGTIADADALIAGLIVPPVGGDSLKSNVTSSLNDALTAFNEGTTGPGHCGD